MYLLRIVTFLLIFGRIRALHTDNTIMEGGDNSCSADAKSDACSSVQMTEIEQIKQTYAGQVKIISDIGEFSNVITINPEGQDLQCKFQLTDNYPDSLPVISIRSSVLDAEQTAAIVSHLQNESASKQGQAMLEYLVASGQKWLQDNDIDISEKASTEKPKVKKRQGKTGKKSDKSKSENEADDSLVKKPPMKTAGDVVKRLQWDEAFNKEDFIVGYIDRMKGLVEKNFTAFTWEDLATVDWFSLAIPQHRIQYFKYKTEKVWDKNERLDNVFGSTGSGLTLTEVVQRYDEKQRELEDGASGRESNREFQDQCAVGTCSKEVDEEKEPNVKNSKMLEDQEARFNHFVAFQITNEELIEKVTAVQERFIKQYPQYAEFKSPPNGFHLTLAVFKIDADSGKQECVEAMNASRKEIEELAKTIKPLSFQGLDSFTTKVVFAKVIYTREFLDLVDLIRRRLRKAGFQVDTLPFKAHLTMFKVRNSVYADKNWKKDRLILTQFAKTDFGTQPVDNIQVCQMGTLPKEEEAKGFYESIFRMDIDFE